MTPTFNRVSWLEAKAQGLRKYFTGKPCSRGHVARRNVSGRQCEICVVEISAAWKAANRDTVNERSRARYDSDPEPNRERARKWHHANVERSLTRAAAHRRNNAQYYKDKHREWAQANKGAVTAITAKRNAAKLRRTPLWADLDAIAAFYRNRPHGMTVDHIVPLQGELVSGLHVLNNLQYLTQEANSAKKNRFDPDTYIHEL